MSIELSCAYCLEELSSALSCTDTCLTGAGIAPAFPFTTFLISIIFSIALFISALHFKEDLKKFITLRMASIAFVATGIFVLGLVFNNYRILKDLPYLIPLVGISSYFISHFFSFYIIKVSYKAEPSAHKKNLLKKLCKLIDIKLPAFYIILDKQPKAFSVDGFRKAIFISKGLLEKLSDKELEAVILHELYHLKRKSGSLKNLLISLSHLNFRIIPAPIKALELYEEEEVDKILLEKHGIDMHSIKQKL